MTRCIELVKNFSNDIKMDIGLEKCAVLHIEKGILSDEPFTSEISNLDPANSYKYLGISESFDHLYTNIKVKTTSDYVQIVWAMLKAKLTAKNTSQALNSFAMPILRYTFSILRWTKTELLKIDRQIRKIHTSEGLHHLNSNTHRLNLWRISRGRGIGNAYDSFQQECSSMERYLNKHIDDTLTNTIKLIESTKLPATYIIRYRYLHLFTNPIETSKTHIEEYTKMPMNGKWRRRCNAINKIDTKYQTGD